MDADNELYDAACGLLEATERLLHAAQRPGLEPALAATVGCLGSSPGTLTSAAPLRRRRRDAPSAAAFGDVVEGRARAPRACELARARSHAAAAAGRGRPAYLRLGSDRGPE